jgi:hypothetical protein
VQAALCTFLPILHSHCLPALPASLQAAESSAAASFCEAFLQAWQQQQQLLCGQAGAMDTEAGHVTSSSSSNSSSAGVPDAQLHSCLLLGLLAAHCSLQDQQQLVIAGCEWVSTAAAAAAAAAGGESLCVGARPVCLAAAVLCAARPGLLTAPSVVDLVASLATLSIASSSSSSSALDGTIAGIGLASVVHKCCAFTAAQRTKQQGSDPGSAAAGVVTADTLLAAALPQLLECLQQPAAQQQQQQALGAVHAASWLSRGLALQRHDGWQQCMQAVLQLLASDSAVQVTEQHAGQQHLLWAAAEYFTVLVVSPAVSSAAANSSPSVSANSSSSSTGAKLGLQLSLHCSPRPLWQQKAFTLALQALANAISSHQQAAAAAAAEAQPQEQQQQGLGQWLAVACLLSSAPPAVAAAARETAVPLLLQCLVRLVDAWPVLAGSSSHGPTAAAGAAVVGQPSGPVRLLQLLHSSLLMVADLLVTASQSTDLLEVRIGTLLDVLCKLARLLPAGSSKQLISSSTTAVMNKAGNSMAALAAAAGGGGEGSSKQRAEVAAGAAAVREVALMCLTSVMGLPYHLLHPYR